MRCARGAREATGPRLPAVFTRPLHAAQVFGAQEAVDAAAQLLAEGLPPKPATQRLLNVAIREKRCKDNCSLLLVNLSRGGR
jgi:hypothetical protein